MRVKVVKSLGRLGSDRELPDDLARQLIAHAYAAPVVEVPPGAVGVPGQAVPPTEILTPGDDQEGD